MHYNEGEGESCNHKGGARVSKRDYVDCESCRRLGDRNIPVGGPFFMPVYSCGLGLEVVLFRQVECESFEAKVGTMESIRTRYPHIEWELDEKGDPQKLTGTLKIGGEIYTTGNYLPYSGLDMEYVEDVADRLASMASSQATKAIRYEALSRMIQ